MKGVKDRRVRASEFSYPVFERVAIERQVAPGDDHRVGAPQPAAWLAQASEWDHLRLIERLGRVEEQKVQITRQPQVLITVIENEDGDLSALLQPSARGVTIAINDHARARAGFRQ